MIPDLNEDKVFISKSNIENKLIFLIKRFEG